ncbi:methionine adenosyltransferase domain-containing protein, partial [Wolbachia endosymbiont of Nasonia vitripennis]|uniref:methionine adenosyltransferase domain-containing protein n=1 Tax=Wolbachia endosymbiont of Nasonia vitripennis TaxID=180837 RepID=UPI003A88C6AE
YLTLFACQIKSKLLHIIRHLSLNRPIYKRTACYGHFGKKLENDGGFSWEGVELSTDFCREFNIEDKSKAALKF